MVSCAEMFLECILKFSRETISNSSFNRIVHFDPLSSVVKVYNCLRSYSDVGLRHIFVK